MESPRLRAWAVCWKLLLLAALAHAFLLRLLRPAFEEVRQWLLTEWCHRTGQRSRNSATPLYHLRLALTSLWLVFRPLSLPRLNPG